MGSDRIVCCLSASERRELRVRQHPALLLSMVAIAAAVRRHNFNMAWRAGEQGVVRVQLFQGVMRFQSASEQIKLDGIRPKTYIRRQVIANALPLGADLWPPRVFDDKTEGR